MFPISANAFRLAWERAKKKARIVGLHFHDLRHEAISRFFEMGMTVPEMALMSGHRDARMLLGYAHAQTEIVRGKLGG
ncbi:MAG: tyrosine-type recombinase/integrase [Hyphomicrobiales bacterium]